MFVVCLFTKGKRAKKNIWSIHSRVTGSCFLGLQWGFHVHVMWHRALHNFLLFLHFQRPPSKNVRVYTRFFLVRSQHRQNSLKSLHSFCPSILLFLFWVDRIISKSMLFESKMGMTLEGEHRWWRGTWRGNINMENDRLKLAEEHRWWHLSSVCVALLNY